MNTDQLGLELEVSSHRNLSFLAENTTPATVHSISNTIHSYTVQLVISMSRKIVDPMYVCLKEFNG